MNVLPASLLEAIAFAARAHRSQQRKDGQTPYASHPFRVCLIVRQLFGIDDPQVLTAAVLHDTIEDTTTDRDDIDERFGTQVGDWVSQLSKDTRLPDEPREEAYCKTLTNACWQVRVCKLADMYDNMSDMGHLPAAKRGRTLSRTQRYLDTLRAGLPEQARPAFQIVQDLHAKLKAAHEAGVA